MSALRTMSRFAALVAFALAGPGFAAQQAGEITLLTGMGTAAAPDGTVRALQKGSPLYSGEIVSTSANSYANLKFTDGGLVLLRPNSRFQIEDYAYGAAPAGAAVAPSAAKSAPAPAAAAAAELAVTGVTPDPVKPQAGKQDFTVTGRGFKPGALITLTDLTHNRSFADRAPVSVTAGKIERPTNFGPNAAHWQVVVKNPDGKVSAAYDFGVGMTVAHAPPAAPAAPAPVAPPTAAPPAAAPPVATAAAGQNQRAFFRLLKGGFRTVSGLIGKSDVNAYKVTTPVATIGIRGTDYIVVLCDAACAADPVVAGSAGAGGAGGGTIVGVISGGIFMADKFGKTTDVGADQYVVKLPDGSEVKLPFEPKFLRIDPIPNPQNCK